MKSRKSGAS